MGVSLDLRYLISGSQDSTVRVWPLNEVHGEEALVNRWGARFEIRGDELQVAAIREDGPLYFRGVHQGDVIRRLRWAETEPQNAPAAESIIRSRRHVARIGQPVVGYPRRI